MNEQEKTPQNRLYYGENYNVMRTFIPDESIDLIVTDPPYGKKRNFNVFKRNSDGSLSQAQEIAYTDTWEWTHETQKSFDIIQAKYQDLAPIMSGFKEFLKPSGGMAYLVMMALRFGEFHRILRKTGSLYFMCDSGYDSYLRVIADSIFGLKRFKNDLVWRRTGSHNDTSRAYGHIHDIILFYTKSSKYTYNVIKTPYTLKNVNNFGERGWKPNSLTGPDETDSSSGKPWRGFNPSPRHWMIPNQLSTLLPPDSVGWDSIEKLEFLYGLGRDEGKKTIISDDKVVIDLPRVCRASGHAEPTLTDALPSYRQYISVGIPLQDIWAYQPGTKGCLVDGSAIDEDVKWPKRMTKKSKERYPTEKPVGLFDRIVKTSSNEGDTVLDPFCGCGPVIDSAISNKRRFIGIDVSSSAIEDVQRHISRWGLSINKDYDIIGMPIDVEGARKLAHQDRKLFEKFVVNLLGGTHTGKSGDMEVDGFRSFYRNDNTIGKYIISVKSGAPSPVNVRSLAGSIEPRGGDMGLLVISEEPTKQMIIEAQDRGSYMDGTNSYQKIQIRTIGQLLKGDFPKTPRLYND